MKVLVCGGRDYLDIDRVKIELDIIHKQTPITCIIEGGARGADHLAAIWSGLRDIPEHIRVRAEWATYGKGAGHMRNQKMLLLKPDLVVAFPGGTGTADMVKKAKATGVPVIEIK